MRAIAVAMPDTPGWYEARRFSIGASEAAAVCGLSKWETPMSVYLRKTGQIPEKIENVAMRMGKRLEPAIREEWSMLTGQSVVYPVPMYRHPDLEFVTATPDGLVGVNEGLECKATTGRNAGELGEEGTDQISTEWLIQAQQQCAVCDLTRVHFAVLIDGRDLRCYVVNRNEELIDALLTMNAQMWHRVINREPPDWDFSHPSTPEVIKALYNKINGESVELSDLKHLWIEYRQLGEQIKEMEARRDAVKAEVLAEMGEAEVGIVSGLGIEIVRSEVRGCTFEVNRKPYIAVRERQLHVKRKR